VSREKDWGVPLTHICDRLRAVCKSERRGKALPRKAADRRKGDRLGRGPRAAQKKEAWGGKILKRRKDTSKQEKVLPKTPRSCARGERRVRDRLNGEGMQVLICNAAVPPRENSAEAENGRGEAIIALKSP